jgi:uncharacterized protein (TIGR01777 family)
MQILITGATGMIGRALILRLLRDGHRISAWVRSPQRAAQLLGGDVDILSGSAEDPTIIKALAQAEAIINLAGNPIHDWTWRPGAKHLLWTSRVDFTRKLVSALPKSSEHPQVLLSASAIGIYGKHAEHTPCQEESSSGDDYLSQLCTAWEAAAQTASSPFRRVVLARIGIVLAHEGGALPQLLLRPAGISISIEGGEQKISFIHLHDLIEWIYLCLKRPEIAGPINMVAPEVVSLREIESAIHRFRDSRLSLSVPKSWLHATLGEAAQLFTQSLQVSAQKALNYGFPCVYPTITQALGNLLAPAFQQDQLVQNITTAVPQAAKQLPVYLKKRQSSVFQYFETETLLAAPPEDVFAFCADAAHLSWVMPSDMHLEIANWPPPPLQNGTIIQHRFHLGGRLALPWHTQIIALQQPNALVDAQLKGPYRAWWHEHIFEKTPTGNTLMRDRLYFSLWGGSLTLGYLKAYLHAALERVFCIRRSAFLLRFGHPTLQNIS